MKIVRWFLSHFFLILLIVVVIYGYMFWGNLAGENTPAGKAVAYLSSEFVEVDDFVKAVKAKQMQQSAELIPAESEKLLEKPVDDQSATTSEDTSPVNDSQEPLHEPLQEQLAAATPEVSEAAVAKEITQQPVSISYSHNQMRVKQNSIGDIESLPEILPQTKVAAVSVEPDTQVEVVTEVESDAESATQVEAAVDIEPAPQVELVAGTEPAAQVEVIADAEPEPEPVLQVSVPQVEIVADVEPAPQVEVVADTEPAAQVEVVADAESLPVVKHEELAENNALLAAEKSSPVVTAIAEEDTSNNFVSPKVERQLNNVDKNGKVISSTLKSYAIRDSWVTARKSFYQRKYALSEQSYRDVINNTSDNFDAYGELGNVYFNQGKNAEAASAYFEAASIMVRKGQIGRARSLMGPLRHLDKNKAVDLQKLIDSAAS